jgi:hypothetical protein
MCRPKPDPCDFDWNLTEVAIDELVGAAAHRYRALLSSRPNRVDEAVIERWSPRMYLWHVVDVLRLGTERLWQLRVAPSAPMAPWDENALAAARNYSALSTELGLHALGVAASEWIAARAQAPREAFGIHPQRGRLDALVIARSNAHEVHHHELDIRRALYR